MSTSTGRRWSPAIGVAIFAVVTHLVVQVALGFYSSPEAWEYDSIARSVAAGEGYSYVHNGTTYRGFAAPIFPLVLAAGYAIFGPSAIVAGALQLALSAALAVATYALGVGAGGRTVGILAGLAVSCHPGLLVYSAKIHSLVGDAALMTWSVWAVIRLRDAPTTRRAVLLGGLTGIAVLERATVTLFAIAALGVHLWRGPDRRSTARNILIVVGLAIAVGAPWVIRNTAVIGSPVLSTTGGEILWYGNNPNATGGAVTDDGRPMIEADQGMKARVWGRPELEQDRVFQQAAISFIREDPLRAAQRDLRKIADFWWFSPRTGLLYPPQWLVVYEIYYVILVGSAAAGVILLARRGPSTFLGALTLVFVVETAAHAAYYVEGRHRWEIEALLLVLAAVAAADVWRRQPRIELPGRRSSRT